MAALLQLLQSIDWDAPARRLASVGIPAGTAHFVFANFAAAFLSWFIPHIPTVRGRNLYCAVVGIALSFYSYGWDTLFLVFATVVSYVFMLASRRRCGPVTWVFGVGFLLAWWVPADAGRPLSDLAPAATCVRCKWTRTPGDAHPLLLPELPRRSHVLAGSQDRWQKGFIPFTGARPGRAPRPPCGLAGPLLHGASDR